MGQVNWIFSKDELKSADTASQKSTAFMRKCPVSLLLLNEDRASYFSAQRLSLCLRTLASTSLVSTAVLRFSG